MASHIEAELGGRIRNLRESKGMKIVDVAKATGLTSSMISQVERGLISPSIETLQKIADVLHIPIGYLFFDEDQLRDNVFQIFEDYPVVTSRNRKMLLKRDGVIYYSLNPGSNGGPLRLNYAVFQPGAQAQVADYSGYICGFVLEGELEVRTGEKRYYLQTGDSITLKINAPYTQCNVGDQACICLWVSLSSDIT